MRLKAIPEVHPLAAVIDEVPSLVFPGVNGWSWYLDPFCVLKDGFWEDISRVTEEEDGKQRLVALRRIIDHQIGLVRRLEPTTLYIEGSIESEPADAVALAARKIGHNIVYLDTAEDLSWDMDRDGYISHNDQVRRERRWVDTITRSSGKILGGNDPWIIAGADHVDGKYGLPKRLQEAGIILDIDEESAGLVRAYDSVGTQFAA